MLSCGICYQNVSLVAGLAEPDQFFRTVALSEEAWVDEK